MVKTTTPPAAHAPAASTSPTPTPERRSARERLLAAADELFYEGGIHSVGIDRVIERAGVAKASLYDTFGSKDELVRCYLQSRHEARKARIADRLARHADPRQRLLAVFDGLADLFAQPSFRGCAFARAAAESRPGGGVKIACDEARGWMRELLEGLAREAGAADPAALAHQLMLLYDGALVSAQMDGAGAAAAAREAAGKLLAIGLIPAARPAAKVARKAPGKAHAKVAAKPAAAVKHKAAPRLARAA